MTDSKRKEVVPIRAVLIHPQGVGGEILINRNDWVNDASRYMDGAFIEAHDVGVITFLADEDGLSKGLPFNLIASAAVIGAGAPQCLRLVGPIILTGRRKNGYPTDAPDPSEVLNL